jgi:hypothetical protein
LGLMASSQYTMTAKEIESKDAAKKEPTKK